MVSVSVVTVKLPGEFGPVGKYGWYTVEEKIKPRFFTMSKTGEAGECRREQRMENGKGRLEKRAWRGEYRE